MKTKKQKDKPQKPKEKLAPVPTDVCPICGLPWNICTFCLRVEKLDFGSNETKSKIFRNLHADVCPTCRRPHRVCHQKKIVRVKARIKKDSEYHMEEGQKQGRTVMPLYFTDDKFKAMVANEKCIAPKILTKIIPVVPAWYVPEP
jgi:glutaredoxin